MAPVEPDAVGTIVLKELDDVVVVVGANVGLVQGAAVVPVDPQ